jgi:hypothetical protein
MRARGGKFRDSPITDLARKSGVDVTLEIVPEMRNRWEAPEVGMQAEGSDAPFIELAPRLRFPPVPVDTAVIEVTSDEAGLPFRSGTAPAAHSAPSHAGSSGDEQHADRRETGDGHRSDDVRDEGAKIAARAAAFQEEAGSRFVRP